MIQLPCYLTGFSSKSDGSASLRFSTQELTAEDFGELQRNLNGYGFLLFKENEISLEDIPNEDIEDTSKTPSKRLRASLYVLWKQRGSSVPFETYYRDMVEKFIDKVKSQLD